MKKIMSVVLSACILGTLFTACGSKAPSTPDAKAATPAATPAGTGKNETPAPSKKVTITFSNYLQEYPEQLKKLQEIYAKENPNVTIENNTVGSDYDKVLQTKLATGDIPDVFLSGSYAGNQNYAAASEDLTNEPFWGSVDPASYKSVTATDGKRVAVPIMAQAWGIVYNKDVFQKAGITKNPETLTELKDVIAKLKAANVIPFSEGFKENWVRGQLLMFPMGVDPNVDQVFTDLLAKKVKVSEVAFFPKLLDIMDIVKANSQPKPFDTDFNAQTALVGQGKAAMMTQGDWGFGGAMKANPDAKLGMMGIPMSEDPKDCKIYVQPSIVMHVGKGVKNMAEAKKFVNWIVTSNTAKDWFGKDLKVLSPIKGVNPEGNSVLADAVTLMGQGKTGTWGATNVPTGLGDLLNPIGDKYLAGKITRDQALAEFNEVFTTFVPKK